VYTAVLNPGTGAQIPGLLATSAASAGTTTDKSLVGLGGATAAVADVFTPPTAAVAEVKTPITAADVAISTTPAATIARHLRLTIFINLHPVFRTTDCWAFH
jgi:hypothetical protein